MKVNRSIQHITGYAASELTSKTFQDITLPEDLQLDLASIKELPEGKKFAYHLQKRYIHKQGHCVWALLSVSLVRNANNEPLHFVAQVQDISESKNKEHQRLLANDQQQTAIAYELHENIAKTLASLKSKLIVQEHDLSRNDLREVVQNLSSVITDITNLSHTITSSFSHDSLHCNLVALLDHYKHYHVVLIEPSLDEQLKTVDLKSAYHLYKIIEEYLKLSVLNEVHHIRLTISMNHIFKMKFEIVDKRFLFQPISNPVTTFDIKTRMEIIQASHPNTNPHLFFSSFDLLVNSITEKQI